MRGLASMRLPARQRGAALLILLGLVSLILIYAVVAGLNRSAVDMALERAQKTATALAQAKDALIGYAVSQTAQPGILPCPDNDNDGSADSPCGISGVTAIGRLPWKTLGLPDLRDGSGECLWYAVSANFKNSGLSGPSVVNSDSPGTLIVKDGTGTALPSPPNPVIAIVFAPGKILSSQSQNRTPPVGSTAVCGGNNVAANYLEGSNASAGTAYVTSSDSNTFNDRLLLITGAELMSKVEQRVAREMLKVLRLYKLNSGCNCYPWPDISTGFSDTGLNRGRIPGYDLSGTTSPPYALPVDWGVGGAPALPQWFIDNGWRRIIYYAVGRNFVATPATCPSCESGQTTLRVNNVPGTEVVILTPGPIPTPGAGRPAASYPWTDWTPYLVDTENRNNDDHYVTPSARNRIFTIP